MAEQAHLRLVDRLRGQYHIPVNDGAGPLNGSMTFSREFPTPPIQKEAADLIEAMLAALQAVEEWWLREGMNQNFGAPYAIFATREAIAKATTPQPTP